MDIFLSEARTKKEYIIGSLKHKDGGIKQRLYAYGFISGARIKIARKSLFKKVFIVDIGGVLLCIRKDLLSDIIVREI